MRERVLITGASGFVGYHLINEALQNNLEVYAAIRKSSSVEHLKGLDVKFVYLDFENVDSLIQELQERQYHYIIHAAGSLRALTPAEYDHINADYTYNLAHAAAIAGQTFKKFVLISSLAAVGPLNILNGIITEDTVPKPITAYGKSKLLAESRLQSFTDLNYTILRPTAVYGPRDKDIFIFLKQVAKGIEPYIGRIDQKLSFIYVGDLARAAIKALHCGSRKPYILSDGNFYNRYQLANITKSILSVKTVKFHIPVKFVKMVAVVAEKVSYLTNKAPVINPEKLDELKAINWSCAIEPAINDLSYRPLFNLQDGLKQAFTWYKANQWL
ncbi:MAG: NAD-dependent epimerase/dehydratase family protein [Mucilaginibacter sp.]